MPSLQGWNWQNCSSSPPFSWATRH